MEMIQQLQRILHDRVIAVIIEEAKTLAGTMKHNGMMDVEVGAIVERKYRELGIVVNLEYGSAYVAKDLKFNTEHPYYKKKMDSAVFQFEIDLTNFVKASKKRPAKENEESAS